jgi:hypothetical protein
VNQPFSLRTGSIEGSKTVGASGGTIEVSPSVLLPWDLASSSSFFLASSSALVSFFLEPLLALDFLDFVDLDVRVRLKFFSIIPNTSIIYPITPPSAPSTGSGLPSPSASSRSCTLTTALDTPFDIKFSYISAPNAALSSAFLLASLAALFCLFYSSLMASCLSFSSLTCFFLSDSALTVAICSSSSVRRWLLAKIVGTDS